MSGCPACGAGLPAGARFCPACGTPLHTADATGGERRVVTVVFADLANLGSIAADLDAEAVRALLDGCVAALQEVVTAHGGIVDKVVGVEVMAVFGVPTANEDDAERAVRAGLGLGPALAGVDRRLVVRVGVNTGEVLAAPVGPAGGATVTGDAVNTAHRLVSVAKPGEVLVGERTWLPTRGTIEYETRQAFRVRGKRDAVAAHAALGALGLPGERPWQSRTAPLAGRTGELSRLRAAAQRAFTTSTPAMVVVAGDAGMGKTRLVLELQARLWDELPAGLFLWGRCPSYGAPPAWPMAQVLRNAFGIDPVDDRDEATAKLDAGLEGLGEPPAEDERKRLVQLLGIGPDHDCRRADGLPQAAMEDLLAAAGAVLVRLAASQPTVVVLDDLHWANRPLLAALVRLVERSEGVPLLVVATGRSQILEEGSVLGGDLVVLEPLADAEAAAVLDHLLASPHHPSVPTHEPTVAVEAFARRRVVDAAGGNPFFLEELVNYLVDSGALASRDGVWTLRAEISGGALPDSVRAVLGARLDRLSARERRFLQEASVAGDRFSRELVAWLGGWDPAGLDGGVRALVQRGILQRRPPEEVGDLAFRHVLTRDVVYASLPLQVRAERHVRVATWLQERFGPEPRGEALDRIARHYERAVSLGRQLDAHDPALAARARVALVRAARQAVSQDALADAERLLRRARAVAGDDHTAHDVDVLLDHADVLTALGRSAEARATLRAATEAAERFGRGTRLAAAAARLAPLPGGDDAVRRSGHSPAPPD